MEKTAMEKLYKISKNLKALRRQFNYTQAFVAKRLNISRKAYQSYESGLKVPTLLSFIKIAELYDLYLEELLE